MIYYFEHGFSISMTLKQAESCSHSGQCDEDVQALSRLPAIRRQLVKIPPEAIAAELKEHGAWDEIELQDYEQNIQRILWITANNISEEHYDKNKRN
ncbi:Phage protein [Azospirillaceae bacterium]